MTDKHPAAWWVAFSSGKNACVEADTDAAAIALASELTGREALTATILPYPAQPRLNSVPWPNGIITPSFCYRPDQCKGRTACPQRYSCTE